MRIENENASTTDGLNGSLPISDFLTGNDHKLKVAIEKSVKEYSFLQNPVFNIPPRIIFNDVRSKLSAGFERWIYGTRELRIYLFPLSKISALPKINRFNKNSIEDILLYRQTSLRQPTRRKFLDLVKSRFDRGMCVYTYVEDDVLQSYMWIDPNPQTYYGYGVDQNVIAVPNSIYVQDAFTNPFIRAKGLGQAGFCQLAHDAAQIANKNCLYLAVFGTNSASLHAVEKLGTILQTSYFCKTKLGFRKTWKIEHLNKNFVTS